MDASLFIARKLRFKGKLPMVCIIVSFFIMTIAVAIASGFRNEIRMGVSSISGDVQFLPISQNFIDESSPIERNPEYLEHIVKMNGVKNVEGAIYRVGIIKNGDNIHGVLFKGCDSYSPADTSIRFPVSIPRKLSSLLGVKEGDKLQTYFVGDEKIRARNFTVESTYDAILNDQDKLVVYVPLADMQRLNGWDENWVSALEVHLEPGHNDAAGIEAMADQAGSLSALYGSDDEVAVYASSSVSKYPQLFDWLNVIDMNVVIILILMTIVAGFNMISGLLIMLFENISTIGTLKALGMNDKAIAKVFLTSSSELVLKGMLAGTLAAGMFCAVQYYFHLIPLNPENYFISFVPVHVNAGLLLCADLAAYFVIMLLLLIPCHFISKVDPARTVRVL